MLSIQLHPYCEATATAANFTFRQDSPNDTYRKAAGAYRVASNVQME